MGDRTKEEGTSSSREGECKVQSPPTQACPSGEHVRGGDPGRDRIGDDPSNEAALGEDPAPKGRKRPRWIGNVDEGQGACSSGHSPTPVTVSEPRETAGEAAPLDTSGEIVTVSSGVDEPCEGVSRTGSDEPLRLAEKANNTGDIENAKNVGNAENTGNAGKGPAETPVRRRKRKKRQVASVGDSSESWSEGEGDCTNGKEEKRIVAQSPPRRRTRSARAATRGTSSFASFPVVHVPLPPTTKDDPLVINSDDDDDAAAAIQPPDARAGVGAGAGGGAGAVVVAYAMEGSSTSAVAAGSAAKGPEANFAVLVDYSSGGVNQIDSTSNLVATDFGDGVMEARTPGEQQSAATAAMPHTIKVKLAWGVAYVDPRAIRPIPHETRLTFPDKDTPGAVEVRRLDVVRLQETVFINDTLIDFYLRYLLSREDTFGGGLTADQVHVFSPLFFQALSDVKDSANPNACGRLVEKWTKGLNLFSKKLVFFPINSCLHWSLAVLCNPHLVTPAGAEQGVPLEQGGKSPPEFVRNLETEKGMGLTSESWSGTSVGLRATQNEVRVDVSEARIDVGEEEERVTMESSISDLTGASVGKVTQESCGAGERGGAAFLGGSGISEAEVYDPPPCSRPWPSNHAWLSDSGVAGHSHVLGTVELASEEHERQISCVHPDSGGQDQCPSGALGDASQVEHSPRSPTAQTLSDPDPDPGPDPDPDSSPSDYSQSASDTELDEDIAAVEARSNDDGGLSEGDHAADVRETQEQERSCRAGELVGGGRRGGSKSHALASKTSPRSTAATNVETAVTRSPQGESSGAGSSSTAKSCLDDCSKAETDGCDSENEVIVVQDIPSAPASSEDATAGNRSPTGLSGGLSDGGGVSTATSRAGRAGVRQRDRSGYEGPVSVSRCSLQELPASHTGPAKRPVCSPPTSPSGTDAGSSASGLDGTANATVTSSGVGMAPVASIERHRDDRGKWSGHEAPTGYPGRLNPTMTGDDNTSGEEMEDAYSPKHADSEDGDGATAEPDDLESPPESSNETKTERIESTGANPQASSLGTTEDVLPPASPEKDGLLPSGGKGVRDMKDISMPSEHLELSGPTTKKPKVDPEISERDRGEGSSAHGGEAESNIDGGKGGDDGADGNCDNGDGDGKPVAASEKEAAGAAGVAGLEAGCDGDQDEVPCILMLDSTKGHRSQEVFRTVRRYVCAAWRNSHQEAGEVRVTPTTLPGLSLQVPQQTNDCDCGVYVIHYAKLMMRTPPRVTREFVAKRGKGSMFSERWFEEGAIRQERRSIRDRIESLRWEALQRQRRQISQVHQDEHKLKQRRRNK